MELQYQQQILDLVKKEIVPAIGCTEPIAVALCVAKAVELLEEELQKITVYLSPNVLKNAMGVGIPGTNGQIGLPIAIALGALVGKSEYKLEVLKDVDDVATAQAIELVNKDIISIKVKEGISDTLYIEVICDSKNRNSKTIIAGNHQNFIYLASDDKVLLDKRTSTKEIKIDKEIVLDMKLVYDFSMNTPIKDMKFILDAGTINTEAAELSLKTKYGHGLGNTLQHSKLMGHNIFNQILTYTTAACDARMGGAKIKVMSNSGSGNQGIAANVPVMMYAKENNVDENELIRALMLSNLTVIYIKQKLGRLSALCGCVIASSGASCGIVHLMGGGYDQVGYAIKNMIANLTGMICDGAKPSCAMKLSSGVSTAVFSAILAMEQTFVTSTEGIIEDDVDKSIDNLIRIGRDGMQETDKLILHMMTNKK